MTHTLRRPGIVVSNKEGSVWVCMFRRDIISSANGGAWRDPKSGLWTVAGMREGSEGRVVLSDGEARAFARLVCRDEPAAFATPAENETAVNASGGAGGEQARIHAAEALHRLGRV